MTDIRYEHVLVGSSTSTLEAQVIFNGGYVHVRIFCVGWGNLSTYVCMLHTVLLSAVCL